MTRKDASKNPHAVALGRLGGLAGKGKSSPAHTAAARANSKLGGWPKGKKRRPTQNTA